VTVDMGTVRFSGVDVPVLDEACERPLDRDVLDELLAVDDATVRFSAATVGNPHCVVHQPATAQGAQRLGPLIEVHPRFPNRTNVQFLEVLSRDRIRIEIWERGAGYTLASGSSSCAAAAVAYRLGLCDGAVTVVMPGGELQIQIRAASDAPGARNRLDPCRTDPGPDRASTLAVTMTGPVAKVGDGTMAAEALTLAEGGV
jgi:diaminopimelate epimerase